MAFQLGLIQFLFDASSLIYLEQNKKMTTLRKLKGSALIPKKVTEEVNQPGTPLGRFIQRYPGVVTGFQDTEEETYLQVRSQKGIHDGEAAAIAISMERRLTLVIDDGKGKAKAQNHNIRTLGWTEFLKPSLFG